MRSYRIEEPRGHGEDRHVLQIRVMIKAVAGNVVSIVSPLPPSNAYPSQAVPREDLCNLVETIACHNHIVARIMAHISTLHPKQP